MNVLTVSDQYLLEQIGEALIVEDQPEAVREAYEALLVRLSRRSPALYCGTCHVLLEVSSEASYIGEDGSWVSAFQAGAVMGRCPNDDCVDQWGITIFVEDGRDESGAVVWKLVYGPLPRRPGSSPAAVRTATARELKS